MPTVADVKSQRVFITGASSGIGESLGQYYASQGARLGLVARRETRLKELVASLPNSAQHRIYALDVTDHAALAAAAEDFIRAHGGIDVVIANAGISRGTLTEYAEDLAVFERILATNLNAMVATFAPFLRYLKSTPDRNRSAGAPRLVGIASVAGMRGLPGAGAYSASKAGVISYCESLRVELRDTGIRVVTIVPGYIATPMTAINSYRMPFLMPVDRFAEVAAKAIERGQSYRVIPWQMGVVAGLLRYLPNWLYDFLFSKAPHKTRESALPADAGHRD